ncbi:hypothetical protein GCM10011607_29020 [Shewanella inventionis]|uniref:Uncharacterized protein n=1 Tax=Shewanella inventionis TaxID=1738770 RepID=A0ABQ1JI44_9GAMM|nr:hypothetical protein [Shewanella inventionis]GGB66584.1 hypothetical protein GCM10011607_29020 [Shewanella inventionis]
MIKVTLDELIRTTQDQLSIIQSQYKSLCSEMSTVVQLVAQEKLSTFPSELTEYFMTKAGPMDRPLKEILKKESGYFSDMPEDVRLAINSIDSSENHNAQYQFSKWCTLTKELENNLEVQLKNACGSFAQPDTTIVTFQSVNTKSVDYEMDFHKVNGNSSLLYARGGGKYDLDLSFLLRLPDGIVKNHIPTHLLEMTRDSLIYPTVFRDMLLTDKTDASMLAKSLLMATINNTYLQGNEVDTTEKDFLIKFFNNLDSTRIVNAGIKSSFEYVVPEIDWRVLPSRIEHLNRLFDSLCSFDYYAYHSLDLLCHHLFVLEGAERLAFLNEIEDQCPKAQVISRISETLNATRDERSEYKASLSLAENIEKALLDMSNDDVYSAKLDDIHEINVDQHNSL